MTERNNILFLSIGLATLFSSLTGCVKEENNEPSSEDSVTVVHASISSEDPETRTHLEGVQMTWSEGDAIMITTSAGTTSDINPQLTEFSLSDGEGTGIGTFISDTALEGNQYSFAYPASSVSTGEKHHYIMVNFPSEQEYVENGISDGLIPMYGVGTDPSALKFYYGSGIIRLKLYSEESVTIKKIEVITDVPASGAMLAKPTMAKFPYTYFKTTSSQAEANTNTVITYNVPNVELKSSEYAPTEFNICLAASTHCDKVDNATCYKSMQIKIYASDGSVLSKTKTNFVVKGGAIYDFPVLEYKVSEGEPKPEITISLKDGLIDTSNPNTLGLSEPEGLETITVFYPSKEEDMKFNNHPQFAVFKDKIYVTWVGHPKDERSADNWAYYSYSSDGVNWVAPIRIGPDNISSGGWITDGNYIGNLIVMTEGGVAVTKVMTSTDGLTWSEPKTLITNAQVGESVKRLPSGRFIVTSHGTGYIDGVAVRKTRIMYSDAPDGLSGWKQAYLPDVPYEKKYDTSGNQNVARPVESSWYRRSDGVLVMLFRDIWFTAAERTWRLLSSVSYNNGLTWTAPVLTNIPDSDSMQCAGNLEDGRTYFVNNPVEQRSRVPLTLAISEDGAYYDKLYLLRGTPPALRYEGGDKTKGYSYPGSISWNGYLYVGYATNKEDIEISRIPVSNSGLSSSLNDFEIGDETWN